MRLRTIVLPLTACALATAACGSTDTSSSTSGGPAGSNTTTSTTTSHTYTCQTGSIKADGSTALQPLVAQAATAYQAACPGSTITVSGGGSSQGLADAASGTADIGDSDVPVSNAKTIDATTVTDHQVAIVIFAVAVNPKTNVTGLTSQQISDIFTGKVTNWKDVGGADVPVTLIERKAGSGTRLSFDKVFLAGGKESDNPASTLSSTQDTINAVKNADGGVSYDSFASISGTGLVAVKVDGVDPTSDNVKSGQYKYYAHEHMYTKTSPSPLAQSFIDYLLTDQVQNGLVMQLKFLPVNLTSAQSAADQ